MQSAKQWVLFFGLVGLACGEGASEPSGGDCERGICAPASGGSGAGGTNGGSGGRAGSPSVGGSGGSSGGTTGGSGGDPTAGTGADPGSGGSEAGGGGDTGGTSGAPSTGGSGGGGAGAGTSGSGGGGGSAGCQGDECGPIADLDMDFYKCNVEPIFDRSCAMLGCHGSEMRPLRIYARGRLRNDEDLTLSMNPAASGCLRSGTENLAERGTGNVMCEGWTRHTSTEWQKNFESARAFMRDGMDPEASELLTQPTVGGRPHVGIHPFRQGDTEYETIRRWLSGEQLGTTCNPEFN